MSYEELLYADFSFQVEGGREDPHQCVRRQFCTLPTTCGCFPTQNWGRTKIPEEQVMVKIHQKICPKKNLLAKHVKGSRPMQGQYNRFIPVFANRGKRTESPSASSTFSLQAVMSFLLSCFCGCLFLFKFEMFCLCVTPRDKTHIYVYSR